MGHFSVGAEVDVSIYRTPTPTEPSRRFIAPEIEYTPAVATDLGAFASRSFLHDTKIGRQALNGEGRPVGDEHYSQALALRAPQMNSILLPHGGIVSNAVPYSSNIQSRQKGPPGNSKGTRGYGKGPVSASSSITVARAAFDAAIANYPDRCFTLRNGILVIRERAPKGTAPDSCG